MSGYHGPFHELKLRFAFVPEGQQPPDEVMSGTGEWVRFPATFQPRPDDSGETDQATQPGGAGDGPADGSRPSPPGWNSGATGADPGGPDAPVVPAAARADDPIAAFERANEAFAAALDPSSLASPNGSPTRPSAQDEAARNEKWPGVAVHLPDGTTIPDA